MLYARDIMSPDIVSLSPDTEIGKAAALLLDRKINGAPVVDAKSRVVGILCQSDLITVQKKVSLPSLFTVLDGFLPISSLGLFEKEIKKIAAVTVADAMTPDPVTVTPDATIEEVATLMVEKKFHTLPVVENGVLVGVLGKEDVLRTLVRDAAQHN